MFDSRTIRWVVAAAVMATLGLTAGAADLLPPQPPRHLPHGPPSHRPVVRIVPPEQKPRASSGSPTGEHAGVRPNGAATGWRATGTPAGTAADFPTDPSGVVTGGKQFDPDHQFSPDWLSGTAGER